MKAKKILSLLCSVATICTMLTAFSVSASAETVQVAVADEAQLITALAEENANIKITQDIAVTDTIVIAEGSQATIDLDGHSITSDQSTVLNIESYATATIYGKGGSIKITGQRKRGNPAIYQYYGSTLHLFDTKVRGGDTSELTGGQGIIVHYATLYLENCSVSSGNSMLDQVANCAVECTSAESKIYVKNSDFSKGTGKFDSDYLIIYIPSGGKLYDFDGNVIEKPNDKSSFFSVSENSVVNAEANLVTATASVPAPTYTVTIPETVSFGEQKQALAKYKTADVDQYGNKINVSIPFTVSAQNVDNLFDDLGKLPQIDVAVSFDGTLKNGTDTIPYIVKNAESTAFTSTAVFCSFTNSSELKEGETNTASGTVWINRTDITKTASYTGTMTFTISIPDKK